jgi:hypothetical protein
VIKIAPLNVKVRTGTFQQFKDYTLAVARGERMIEPDEPKIWIGCRDTFDQSAK